MKLARTGALVLGVMSLLAPTISVGAEDDYQFMPLHAWRILGETGEDDQTATLVEGFPGLKEEPGRSRWLEPVDGDGGFDNVAPRLEAEEGPGGLEWDPSPTYRTRYKNGTDYAPNTTTTRRLGNNWFTRIPYAQDDSYYNQQWIVRFDANTYRIYKKDPMSSTIFWGQYGNINSKLIITDYGATVKVHDVGGKVYTFKSTDNFKCSKIEGLGGNEVAISYNGTTDVTVSQRVDPYTNFRKFTYTLEASGTRTDKIDVADYDGMSWNTYRTIDFTYHDNITGATGSSSGDLIGIEDKKNLSESGKTYKRNWVFKYYTGTYNESTNPGYPYQVQAVIGPGAVRKYLDDNPTKTVTDIYKTAASSLSSYLDTEYKFHSDRRMKEVKFNTDCGCGGGSGTYTYTWSTNSPSDLNTWACQMKMDLPTEARWIVDYNKYGQTLNYIVQEDKDDTGSRRWIRLHKHDTTGRLTDSYSVAACDYYTDSTHVVTVKTGSSEDGMHYLYSYDSNSALTTVKLDEPGGGELYQRKKAFTLNTSGDRRRFVKTSDTVYADETTTDTGGDATSYSYTYHTADALAVKKRTTTLPVIPTGENGSGSAVSLYDYFEDDGLHTWGKDGDGYVHYTGYDADARVVTITVRNIDTDSADRPSGVPAPPETTFESSTGLNMVVRMEYDVLGRITKRENPAFNAWTGSSVTSKMTTQRWHYTKLYDDKLVVLQYPHVDASYYHAAISIAVSDHEGNLLTSAQGELDSAKRNTNLDEDFDEADATLGNNSGFEGTIIQRTDHSYSGKKRTKTEVWSDADNGSAAKHTSTFSYDAPGRLQKAVNAAWSITLYTYDVLNRRKTRKSGTDDTMTSGNNMTLVEELFYDDEEDASSNVGDGFLTRTKLHTSHTTDDAPRLTDSTYDYRGRVIEVLEELDATEERDYDNLNRVTESRRYDDTGPTLVAKSANYYDPWGQLYESRVYGISGGSGTDYTKEEHWRNGRALTIKRLYQGKVFSKTQYDGAGRVTNSAVSYDTDETAYGDADDLTGDTVIEETRYQLDATGAAELVRYYQRRHNGTGEGGLTVGTSGNGRANYTATWYDEMHRQRVSANYGTNGGTDLTARPSGNPPSSSSSSQIVSKSDYTVKSELKELIDPEGKKHTTVFSDWRAVLSVVNNDVASPTENDEDRTANMTFNSSGQQSKITAVATGDDQETESVFGVTRGTASGNSRIASNDLVKTMKYPDPSTGAPGGADDQEHFAYNALGELMWKKDPLATEHVYEYDDRGRLIHDRVSVLGTGIDGAVRRISRTYDKLDRVLKITSYDNATVGSGSVVNETQYEYDKFGVVKKIYQEWAGAVNTGASPKVQYAYNFPTDGTTGLRVTSVTHPDGTVVTYEYNSGTDDTLSRLSGKKKAGAWIFQEEYLGLGRLVQRKYGDYMSSEVATWTLVGTDTSNNDNYVGLGRFGEIDDLVVKDSSSNNINRYLYTYNYNSQITFREDEVGTVYGYYDFDEKWEYDGIGRLENHKRGRDLNGSPTMRVHECWTLDLSGNTTSFYTGTASTCGTGTSRALNDSNEYTQVGSENYGYDKPGDMTDRGSSDDKKYDAWKRLMSYENGSGFFARYKYNGLNQKVKRTDSVTGLADTYYYYSAENQLLEEEKVSDGSTLHYYVWGTQYIDDIVCRNTSGYNQFHVLDARNNVVTIVLYNGTVDKRFLYESYGFPKQLSADWTTFQTINSDWHLFQGRQYCVDHEQYDFRNRFQDPELGVFVQRDPIGNWGDAANFGNAYTFVGNDPLNRLDPDGTIAAAAVGLAQVPVDGRYVLAGAAGVLAGAIRYGGPYFEAALDPYAYEPRIDLQFEPITECVWGAIGGPTGLTCAKVGIEATAVLRGIPPFPGGISEKILQATVFWCCRYDCKTLGGDRGSVQVQSITGVLGIDVQCSASNMGLDNVEWAGGCSCTGVNLSCTFRKTGEPQLNIVATWLLMGCCCRDENDNCIPYGMVVGEVGASWVLAPCPGPL